MSAAAIVLANILALAADKSAHGRLAKLVDAEQRAEAAESALAERRAAFERRQAAARHVLARMAALVDQRRDTCALEEGQAEDGERWLLEREQEWAGLGLPRELAGAADRPEVDDGETVH